MDAPTFHLNYNGTPVMVSEQAVEMFWAFPSSPHRSKRIHKKLEKRFGPQIQERPAIFYIQGRYFMHPDVYAEMKRQGRLPYVR